MIPCTRPCLATASPPQIRTHGGEPPRDFTADRTPIEPPPSVAVRAVNPPPRWPVGRAAPRRPPPAPRAAGPAGPPAAPARALALGGPKSPPGQQGRKSFFFLFSHFFSHFSHIELYAKILCTKNSSNKIIGHKNNKI
jgi:hypothetical protein